MTAEKIVTILVPIPKLMIQDTGKKLKKKLTDISMLEELNLLNYQILML